MTTMKPDDPAFWMLQKGRRLEHDDYDGDLMNPSWLKDQEVHREYCYICIDPEFRLMGLPLCTKCPQCEDGHVPADDEDCDDCGQSLREWHEENG